MSPEEHQLRFVTTDLRDMQYKKPEAMELKAEDSNEPTDSQGRLWEDGQ